MKIHKGTSRIVFVFHELGFVIKFPIINIYGVVRVIYHHLSPNRLYYLKKWLMFSVEADGGFKWFMFKGLHDNWNEYFFYEERRNTFLQPTYFSLFGFLNIQAYKKSELLDILDPSLDSLGAYFQTLTERSCSKDLHHFCNPKNFCLNNGEIRILDYGSKRTQKIIKKWGEKIVESFKVNELMEIEEKRRKKRELEKQSS